MWYSTWASSMHESVSLHLYYMNGWSTGFSPHVYQGHFVFNILHWRVVNIAGFTNIDVYGGFSVPQGRHVLLYHHRCFEPWWWTERNETKRTKQNQTTNKQTNKQTKKERKKETRRRRRTKNKRQEVSSKWKGQPGPGDLFVVWHSRNRTAETWKITSKRKITSSKPSCFWDSKFFGVDELHFMIPFHAMWVYAQSEDSSFQTRRCAGWNLCPPNVSLLSSENTRWISVFVAGHPTSHWNYPQKNPIKKTCPP